MKSILLLVPPSEVKPGYPRLALAYLSANLDKENIPHEIVDLAIHKDWKKVLMNYLNKFELFGITATTGEMSRVAELTDIIKSNNLNSTIIIGGVHATLFPVETLTQYKNIDFCIRGEGEESLVDFLRAEDFTRVKGICYRKANEIICGDVQLLSDLNNRPFPNYDKFDLYRYQDNTPISKTLQLITSRGCPYHCTYCSKGLGDKFRPRTAEDVVSEIIYLKKKYNVHKLHILDDNFSFDIERAKNICKLIIEKKLNINWINSGGLRVDKIDEELVALMKKSGCQGVGIGIESVDNNILKEYKKGTTVEKVVKAIEIIKKHKISLGGFFLIGAPSDTKDTIYKQLEFAKKMDLNIAMWSNLVPYPDTEIWKWIDKNNYWVVKNPFELLQSATTKQSNMYSTTLLSSEEKSELIKSIEKEWNAWCYSKGGYILKLKSLVIKNPRIFYYATKFKAIYDTMDIKISSLIKK
jgi:radical SAM superfamily enzyme YgiQ (UPF0313 family)